MEMGIQFKISSFINICRRSPKVPVFIIWNHNQGLLSVTSRTHYSYTNSTRYRKARSIPLNRAVLIRAVRNAKEPSEAFGSNLKEKGTVVGAVALIIGTSIGSGILAIPQRTSPAGFVPSAVTMIICWGFLLIEALLLAEINVALLRKKKKMRKDGEMEVISIRTMAQETLGGWGGNLATVTYVFLGYTTMVAYTSKAGDILYHFLNVPSSISGFLFTGIFTILISVGGTRVTDQVNQWLTVSMIGLLVGIEVLAIQLEGWIGLDSSGNWEKVPATISMIIFTLVYHDLSPVICAYLGGDLPRIRTSFILGSIVPLLSLLVWDAIVLGLSNDADQLIDPVDMLLRLRWDGIPVMVETFSLLAVGTSLIGTILGFSGFFSEQLSDFSWISSPSNKKRQKSERSVLEDESWLIGPRKWWRSNKVKCIATVVAVAPPLFISTTVPDVFSSATDIAGGYCMTMLYGVLPPAMAWAMYKKSADKEEIEDEDFIDSKRMLTSAKPVLLGLGIFACGIVVEQVLQDILALYQ